MTDRPSYGTADPEAPVSRADFERALRHLNISDIELRDAFLQLAARVVALTDEMTRRIDGVEPVPAPPGTPAAPATATVEVVVSSQLPNVLANVRAGDAGQPNRVGLDLGGDKYAAEVVAVPCAELIPLCQGRCCKLTFSLSTQDLDEGVVRWDYGQPYLIRQRKSDQYCVHSDPTSRGCTVHSHRPRVCREYDCRTDKRVWLDYEQRIPAAPVEGVFDDKGTGGRFDLMERAQQRAKAVIAEKIAIGTTFADPEPRIGPTPPRRAT